MAEHVDNVAFWHNNCRLDNVRTTRFPPPEHIPRYTMYLIFDVVADQIAIRAILLDSRLQINNWNIVNLSVALKSAYVVDLFSTCITPTLQEAYRAIPVIRPPMLMRPQTCTGPNL
jgi:hypothetical protein